MVKKKGKKKPSPIFLDGETYSIIACAIRYAIGRQTYMPSLVMGWCKRYWGEMTETLRKDLRNEIFRELINLEKSYTLSSFLISFDGRNWCEFLEWVDNFEKKDEDLKRNE